MSESGVHRPHVAGIHGRSNDGAYSLVLAGGYEDDVVCWDCCLAVLIILLFLGHYLGILRFGYSGA